MAKSLKTVTRIDQYGNSIEVPVGADGVNPVSPDNPVAKAIFQHQSAEPQEESPIVLPVPSEKANKGVWVGYAVSKGADPAEADAKSKADLIKEYKN